MKVTVERTVHDIAQDFANTMIASSEHVPDPYGSQDKPPKNSVFLGVVPIHLRKLKRRSLECDVASSKAPCPISMELKERAEYFRQGFMLAVKWNLMNDDMREHLKNGGVVGITVCRGWKVYGEKVELPKKAKKKAPEKHLH